MKKIKTLDICLCAMFAALSAIGAFIRVPLPICPFTLQLTFTTLAGFAPQAIAVAVTAGLHLWRKNTLLSVLGGTAVYMLLVQFVF